MMEFLVFLKEKRLIGWIVAILLIAFGSIGFFASIAEGDINPGLPGLFFFILPGFVIIVVKIAKSIRVARKPVGETTGTDKMRVRIRRYEEPSALPRQPPRYVVALDIVFSDEDARIIKERGLRNTVVDSWPAGADEDVQITIGGVAEGAFRRSFTDMIGADMFEHHIRNEVLPRLRGYIVRHGMPTATSDTFEM